MLQTDRLNLSLISNPSLRTEQLEQMLQDGELRKAVFGSDLVWIEDLDATDFVLKTCFANKCGTFSERLVDHLKDRGIKAIEVTSYDESSTYHVYVALITKEGLQLIDPTIGQYIAGQRNMFIGTQNQLRELIENPDTRFHFPTEDRKALFSRCWGITLGTAYERKARIV